MYNNISQQLSWIKSEFTLKVKFYRKEKDEDNVVLVNTDYSKQKKKKIIHDLLELKDKKGIDIGLVRVGAEPQKVEFNKLYCRADGKMCWLYILQNPKNNKPYVVKEEMKK